MRKTYSSKLKSKRCELKEPRTSLDPDKIFLPSKQTNVIYYDESMKYDPQTYQYFKMLKTETRGAFIGSYSFETLKCVIEEIRAYIRTYHLYPDFTVIIQDTKAEKILEFLHGDDFVKKIIISSEDIPKYLPLMSNYEKIQGVLDDINDILDFLGEDKYELVQYIKGLSQIFKVTPLITYDDYQKYYYKFHKLVSNYFKDCYNDKALYNKEMNLFEKLVNNSPEVPEDARDEIIKRIKTINNDIDVIKNLINAYTGENQFCYGINMWLRGCDPNTYNQIKCFAGTLMYAMSVYAKTNPSFGLSSSMILYRRLTLRYVDLNSYKTCEGDIICFPGFTSTSTNDPGGVFPTERAVKINEHLLEGKKRINGDPSQNVCMIISYKHRPGNIPLATNVGKVSMHPSENEYVFPPFSFFQIQRVDLSLGTVENPHVVKLEAVGKKCLIEPELRLGKTMVYKEKENEMKMV